MLAEADEAGGLWEPWAGLARGVTASNGRGRVNVLRELCGGMADGERVERLVFAANPRKRPRRRVTPGVVPVLPRGARLEIPRQARNDKGEPARSSELDAARWLDVYVDYAKEVSPLTPVLFHELGGLWLVSLAVARRLVLHMAHKDVYPNLAILQIAPTTLYAKSTGLGPIRFLAQTVMGYLLLPGEMTPEAMVEELAGKQPAILEGLDVGEWQRGQAYAAQRGMVLDEASSLFAGMSKDYNIGMGETLLRLFDCNELISRQTRGSGRSTVRRAYFSFLGATTPWHLKKADVETLWHTGIWPRFLLATPADKPRWEMPSKTRAAVPEGLVERLRRLVEEDLPRSTYQEPAAAVSVGMGEGVFEAFSRYLQATMHDLLVPPTCVDGRLWGVYGRLAEQALKVGMLMAALDWDGQGAPVIHLRHWARAQGLAEVCRASAHRLPGMLAESSQNEDETKVLMFLDGHEAGECTARDVYRALNLKSARVKSILMDLEEADLVVRREKGRASYYAVKREE